MLGVGVRHVRRLVADRRIPYLKWGHLLRFDPLEIEAWIDQARRPVDPQVVAPHPLRISAVRGGREQCRRFPTQREGGNRAPAPGHGAVRRLLWALHERGQVRLDLRARQPEAKVATHPRSTTTKNAAALRRCRPPTGRLSPRNRNRVHEVSPTYRNHGVQHVPDSHTHIAQLGDSIIRARRAILIERR
jgi:excisionase family DNA binding protein